MSAQKIPSVVPAPDIRRSDMHQLDYRHEDEPSYPAAVVLPGVRRGNHRSRRDPRRPRHPRRRRSPQILPDHPVVRKLATGMNFTEGPVWFPAKSPERPGYLIFCDNQGDELKIWIGDAVNGVLKSFRKPSHAANGSTRDPQGRLVTCEQDTRCITRTEHDGTIVTLADNYRGKKFNSPNDIVVKSDGTVWFTDPPYGVPAGEKRELDKQYVFRIDLPPAGAGSSQRGHRSGNQTRPDRIARHRCRRRF